jgi:hypothetical protein
MDIHDIIPNPLVGFGYGCEESLCRPPSVCGQPAPDVIRRMKAQYVHTSIHPNFHTRTELAEFV